MKTKKFKPLISLLHLVSFCMVILGVGCSNKDTCSVEQLSGAIDDITGQWRQFKTEQINGGPPALVYDYSCDNIFYSFNEDNVLIVWSDQADYLGFEGGEYTFTFTKSSNGQTYHTLFINDVEHICSISDDNIMTIGLEPRPGPLDLPITFTTLYFVRTK